LGLQAFALQHRAAGTAQHSGAERPTKLTTRERYRRSTPWLVPNCHGQWDPIGFGFRAL
jgi:hypothetical protein